MAGANKGKPLTPAQVLEDLEEEYTQAIYRYQAAFDKDPNNAGAEKAGMNRLEAEVRRMKWGY